MKMTIFYLTCTILAIVPPIFIYHKVYKDGVIGRIALSGISSVAILFILDGLDDDSQYVSRLTVLGFVMFAIFLCWHLWRFHRRIVLPKTDIKEERRKCPDRRYMASGS